MFRSYQHLSLFALSICPRIAHAVPNGKKQKPLMAHAFRAFCFLVFRSCQKVAVIPLIACWRSCLCVLQKPGQEGKEPIHNPHHCGIERAWSPKPPPMGGIGGGIGYGMSGDAARSMTYKHRFGTIWDNPATKKGAPLDAPPCCYWLTRQA